MNPGLSRPSPAHSASADQQHREDAGPLRLKPTTGCCRGQQLGGAVAGTAVQNSISCSKALPCNRVQRRRRAPRQGTADRFAPAAPASSLHLVSGCVRAAANHPGTGRHSPKTATMRGQSSKCGIDSFPIQEDHVAEDPPPAAAGSGVLVLDWFCRLTSPTRVGRPR